MHDHRVINRTALDGKQPLDRLPVASVRAETVNGLRRKTNKSTLAKNLGGARHGV